MITIAWVIVMAYITLSVVVGGPMMVDALTRRVRRHVWHRRNPFSHSIGVRVGRQRITIRIAARYRSPFPAFDDGPLYESDDPLPYIAPSYDTWDADDIRRPFHADRVNAIPGTVRTSVRPDVVFDCDPEPFRRG